MRRWGLMLLPMLLPAIASAQALQDESLLQPVPKGFKVVFKDSHDKVNTMEYVPEAETAENWTEMVTTQTMLGMGKSDMTPERFLQTIQQTWQQSCTGATIDNFLPDQKPPGRVHSGHVNGYPIAMAYLRCPKNPATGKPENTLLRVIKGSDSLYVVQKAFKSEPSKEQMENLLDYMDSVTVCDTRTLAHPCPGGLNKAGKL